MVNFEVIFTDGDSGHGKVRNTRYDCLMNKNYCRIFSEAAHELEQTLIRNITYIVTLNEGEDKEIKYIYLSNETEEQNRKLV